MAMATRELAGTWYFALALVQGQIRHPRGFLTTLLTPIFLLSVFWMTTWGREEQMKFELMDFMFPAIVGFTVIFAGQPMAMRMTTWQQMGVFQRLACTPVPLGLLIVGAILAQSGIALLQAVGVLLFGVLVVGLPTSALGSLVALGVLLLGAICFIAYSLLVASLVRRPESASTLFTFTIMPMFFLGGGLPQQLLPNALQRLSQWLPTTMVNALLMPLLNKGTLPAGSGFHALGLIAYTLLFTALAVRVFRWER